MRLLHESQRKTRCADRWFRSLPIKQCRAIQGGVDVFGLPLFIAASRNERGELMIVVTNAHVKQAISIYLRRWEIETLFGCLKTRGFRFESTHMTHPQRIAKLMAVLAIAVAWAHHIGEWRAEQRPIPLRRFKQRGWRPQYSYFRYGLDYLRDRLLNATTPQHQALRRCIRLLFTPLSQLKDPFP